MNTEENKGVNVDSSEWEEAVVSKAQEVYRDAWDLALETEDEALFERVWNESLKLVVDDVISSLIEKGMVEVAGMLPDGDMTFMLTDQGNREADSVLSRRDESPDVSS